METQIGDVTVDPLFVAVTRPPMKFGVTYVALLVNAALTMEMFLLTKYLPLLFLAIPIHGVCMLLCARDPRYFDLLLMWARTRLVAWFCSLRFWKGASYGPLVVDLPDARGRRRSAATARVS